MPATAEATESTEEAGCQARVAIPSKLAAASKAVAAGIHHRRLTEPPRVSTIRFPAPPRPYFAEVEPPALNDFHLSNSRVLPSREAILPLLPKGGVCAEFGTQTGDFAK